jgi:hypothetical protein
MGLILVVLAHKLGPTGITGDGSDGVRVPAPDTTMVAKATAPAFEGSTGAGPETYASQGTDDPSSQADAVLRMADSPEPSGPRDTAAAQGVGSPAPDARLGHTTGEPDQDAAPVSTEASSGMDDTTYALTLVGIVLAGVGLMALLLSWLARRWQDPLLR